MLDRAQDESVWLSGLCSAFAFWASHSYPSTGSYLLLLLMLGWFVWSIVKKSLDKM